MANEQNEIEYVTAGESKLNSYFAILGHILVTEVTDRPWNMKNNTTKAFKEFSATIQADQYCYPDTFIGTKPAVSSITEWIRAVGEISRKMALQYEAHVLGLKIKRPAGAFSLVLGDDAEVQEIGCVQELFSLDAPVLRFTKAEKKHIQNAGAEDRSLVRANLRLATLSLKIGQSELQSNSLTVIGQQVEFFLVLVKHCKCSV